MWRLPLRFAFSNSAGSNADSSDSHRTSS